jgi:hypothetical protein
MSFNISLFSFAVLVFILVLIIYIFQCLNNSKENYKGKLIILYIFLKSFIVLLMIIVMPIVFDRGYFYYGDLSEYTSCDPNSPNGFFSLYICLLDIDSISNFKAIGSAIIINTFRDLLMITIISKNNLLSKKSFLILIFMLALHPYLAIYHAKLSTSIFAVLGVVIYYYVLIRPRSKSFISDLSFVILSGFRNTFAAVVIPYYAWEIIKQIIGISRKEEAFDYYLFKNILSIFALILIVMLSGKYMFNMINASNNYSLDVVFFAQYIDTPFMFLNTIITYICVILSHLFFLLSFREAAFTEFPDFFIPFDGMVYFHILIGIIFFVTHGAGFFYFLKSYFLDDKRYLLLIVPLLPTLLSVSHLRYFMPFIPLSLLGLAMIFDSKFISKIYH